MATLQNVFARLMEAKREQRELKKIYRDALLHSTKYQAIKEELDAIKEKRKVIESEIKNEFLSEFDRLETLKQQIADDKQMLTDIAINQYVQGESVEVNDEHDQTYAPVFSVTFKKV